MNKSKVFDWSIEECIKVNITWLSNLIEALPKATDQDVKEVMRYNRSMMQVDLLEYVDQAYKEGKEFPEADYHATMCRSYKQEEEEIEAALAGDEVIKRGKETPLTKQELLDRLDFTRSLTCEHGQSLVNILHPNCDGPHEIIIGDRYISLD